MLLFPDGRIASRGWRAVLWVCVAVDAAFVCALGLFALTTIIGAPVSIGLDGQLSAMSNVNGLSGNPFGAAFLALFPFLLATLVVAAAGLIANMRRSHGERRQQLKWFIYAAALSAIGFGLYEVSVFTVGPSTALAQGASVLVIPASAHSRSAPPWRCSNTTFTTSMSSSAAPSCTARWQP